MAGFVNIPNVAVFDFIGSGTLTFVWDDVPHFGYFDVSFAIQPTQVATEPSTLAFLAIGILGIPLLRRLKTPHVHVHRIR